MKEKKKKHIHFVSVGGEVMHSLAITLHASGYQVTGSDDNIYGPSRAALSKAGLLPETMGWREERVHKGIDTIIVGMHAKQDNPELLKAQKLGLPILSYPDFIAQHSKDKQRIVVAGSHGKTTTTAMIMHVLRAQGIRFDYLIGAKLPGFDRTVSLSEESTVMVIEGDEYPSGPLDLTPKFYKYNHHILVLTGISWDHMNYYPSFEVYKEEFFRLTTQTPKGGIIVYNEEDKHAVEIIGKVKKAYKGVKLNNHEMLPYRREKEEIKDGVSCIKHHGGYTALRFFGQHNMANMEAARLALGCLAVEPSEFYQAMSSFQGVSRRLSKVHTTDQGGNVYWDYAHAPSKVLASTRAVKKQFPARRLVAVFEMHTFSSLNHTFTGQYKDTLQYVDVPIVFIDQKVLQKRGESVFHQEMLRKHFNKKDLVYLTDPHQILPCIVEHSKGHGMGPAHYLFMSSGDFGGLRMEEIQQLP